LPRQARDKRNGEKTQRQKALFSPHIVGAAVEHGSDYRATHVAQPNEPHTLCRAISRTSTGHHSTMVGSSSGSSSSSLIGEKRPQNAAELIMLLVDGAVPCAIELMQARGAPSSASNVSR
jgi:hypothetical protein